MTLTRTEWAKYARKLKGIYTYQNFMADADSFDAWYSTLCKYPAEWVERAIGEWIADSSTPPTPADVKEYISRIRTKTIKPSANIQFWRLIDKTTGIVENEVASLVSDGMDCNAITKWFLDRGENLDNKQVVLCKE